MTDEQKVNAAIILVLTKGIAALVDACIDENGKPCEPDKKALDEARKLLPAGYKHSFTKKK